MVDETFHYEKHCFIVKDGFLITQVLWFYLCVCGYLWKDDLEINMACLCISFMMSKM